MCLEQMKSFAPWMADVLRTNEGLQDMGGSFADKQQGFEAMDGIYAKDKFRFEAVDGRIACETHWVRQHL
jgi:hypothetical protein